MLTVLGRSLFGGLSKMSLSLNYIDEVIRVRKALHGGHRGAPRLIAHDMRAGASLNRSCIVLLSAQLQTFVEEVFEAEVRHVMPRLNSDAEWKRYWKQVQRWGNPSDENIRKLFLGIGLPDVLHGLSWQRSTTAKIKENLKLLNEVRNDIAHGKAQLRFNDQPYNLTLAEVVRLRNFAENFGKRFKGHVESKR
jgi:hypothetical protein